jgi:hypothetical protein
MILRKNILTIYIQSKQRALRSENTWRDLARLFCMQVVFFEQFGPGGLVDLTNKKRINPA